MLILAIGDIIGKPGRQATSLLLPELRQEYGVDMVIANAENLAGGLLAYSQRGEAYVAEIRAMLRINRSLLHNSD